MVFDIFVLCISDFTGFSADQFCILGAVSLHKWIVYSCHNRPCRLFITYHECMHQITFQQLFTVYIPGGWSDGHKAQKPLLIGSIQINT